MRPGTRGRHRAVALAIAGSLVGLAPIVVLFDPLPLLSDVVSAARVRWELPRAVERWGSHAPLSYQIHVEGAVPIVCIVDGELSVRDGQLPGVRMRENPRVPESPLLDVDPSEWQHQGCPYEDLTVERMYERVEAGLRRVAEFGAPLAVEFDEEWGYITAYRVGRESRGGALGYTISECCTWFEFDELTALTS